MLLCIPTIHTFGSKSRDQSVEFPPAGRPTHRRVLTSPAGDFGRFRGTSVWAVWPVVCCFQLFGFVFLFTNFINGGSFVVDVAGLARGMIEAAALGDRDEHINEKRLPAGSGLGWWFATCTAATRRLALPCSVRRCNRGGGGAGTWEPPSTAAGQTRPTPAVPASSSEGARVLERLSVVVCRWNLLSDCEDYTAVASFFSPVGVGFELRGLCV